MLCGDVDVSCVVSILLLMKINVLLIFVVSCCVSSVCMFDVSLFVVISMVVSV